MLKGIFAALPSIFLLVYIDCVVASDEHTRCLTPSKW